MLTCKFTKKTFSHILLHVHLFKIHLHCFFQRGLESVRAHFMLAKNDDPNKHTYSGYGIGFDLRLELSLTEGSVDKNVIIFGVNMSSSLHIDNKKKNILTPGKSPTQGLDDTTLTAEAQNSINFS